MVTVSYTKGSIRIMVLRCLLRAKDEECLPFSEALNAGSQVFEKTSLVGNLLNKAKGRGQGLPCVVGLSHSILWRTIPRNASTVRGQN